MDKKKLKLKSKMMEPIVRIGKNGITDKVIIEIKKELKNKHLVKIKMLKSAINNNKKQLALDLAKRTDSTLIDKVGFVVVLYKE